MKIHIYLSFCLAALIFILMSDRAQSLDISKSLEGIVEQIKVNTITIQNTLTGYPAPIAVDTNTVYDNVQKLTDLKTGDRVQIKYQTIQHKNIASSVTKLEVENSPL